MTREHALISKVAFTEYLMMVGHCVCWHRERCCECHAYAEAMTIVSGSAVMDDTATLLLLLQQQQPFTMVR